jgi:GR25 family glycosyltransferase involved in LPS biosynthesis
MNYLLFIYIFFLLVSPCLAEIKPHLRRMEAKSVHSCLRNIDFIYLINLDQRREKLFTSLGMLGLYGIIPERFPAIYGWNLSAQAFSEIGVRYTAAMRPGKGTALYFPPEWNGTAQQIFLSPECYGKTVFSGWTTPGAIGCTLSHLSILYDAYYASKYETIWVLEDDIVILQDPHKLSDIIEELDACTGKEGWDILYTDYDCLVVDETQNLTEQLPMKWRPDMPDFDLHQLLECTPVGAHFFKIGSRNRTHSLIIRRSGMKKILDFYFKHQIFLPYDHELGFIPGLRQYVVRDNIVSCTDTGDNSDTKNHNFL